MTTLRVALDASQMLGTSRQVAVALQQMGEGARATGRSMDDLGGALNNTAAATETARESLKATSGAIQAAGNVRQLIDSLREVDGSFASIANVGANAAQTILAFGRAALDVRQLKEALDVGPALSGTRTAVEDFNALFKETANQTVAAKGAATALNAQATAAKAAGAATVTQAAASRAATTAIAEQGAATSATAGATSLFTRATIALRVAWAAHPVLLIGTVLAAAATAMAAFAGNTKDATEESKRLGEQQQALQRNLENIQRIQAEARIGTQFGIAGAKEEARRREQQAVFQQAVEVETQRFQGGAGVRVSDISRGRPVEEQLNAQQTVRFQQEVERRIQEERLRISAAAREPGARAAITIEPSQQQLQELRERLTKEVAAGFTVGYDEALGILQGRFDELGDSLQKSLAVPLPEVQRQRVVTEFREQLRPTPELSQQERMLRQGEDIQAELARREVLSSISSALAEEARLAGLSVDQRERELAVMRIKQDAQRRGVQLSEEELANIEAQIAAQQGDDRAAKVRELNAEMAEEARLAALSPEAREQELALLDLKQRAMQKNVQLSAAELDNYRQQIATQQGDQRDAKIAALNAAMAEEARLAGLSVEARARELAILDIKEQAQQRNLNLTKQEIAEYERQVAAQQAASRTEVVQDITGQLAEEYRLANLTAGAREQELTMLRIKEAALKRNVELTDDELRKIEDQVRAQRQATFNRDLMRGPQEEVDLMKYTPEQREIERVIIRERQRAEESDVEFTPAQEANMRQTLAAQQQLAALEDTGRQVGASLGNAFVNAASGVATLRSALAGLLQDLLRIAAQRAIIGPLMDALGGAFTSMASTSNPTSSQVTYDTGANAGSYAGTLAP